MSARLVHRYIPRGTAREAMESRAPEILNSGPAGTGKSRCLLEKVHLCAMKYPRSRHLLLRKTMSSLTSTGLVTFQEFVVREALLSGEVTYFGGSVREPAAFRYRNGSIINLGGLDNPTKIMSSEYDTIYCLAGETIVDSPSAIQRGYRRPYSGEIVTVKTAAGHELTGTPNHPVLTDQGWVGLGALHVGDHVVSRVLREQPGAGTDPDVEHRPVPIADVVRSLTKPGAGPAERVRTVAVDFHGDGGHGDVDVVSAARLFHGRGETSLDQPVVQSGGERRDLESAFLLGVCSSFETLGAGDRADVLLADAAAELAHALAVGVGVDPFLRGAARRRGEVALPFGVGIPNVAHGLRLGSGTRADALLGHGGDEPRCADTERLGDHQQPTLAGEVALDRVVELFRGEAPGGWHVYNLQTREGWFYASEIVSHNCQEATELNITDWEFCLTRLRNGKMPYQQLIADANPNTPTHWLKQRADRGVTLMLNSRHEENPILFDEVSGEGGDVEYTPTERGAQYMARLDSLTGVRYLRLRKGLWVAAEGLIYEMFEPAVHVIKRFPIPRDWPRFWSVDFGFVHPFVLQCWAQDPDGRLIMYREIYRTGKTVDEHCVDIMAEVSDPDPDYVHPPGTQRMAHQGRIWREPRPVRIITDHDAESRRTLERHLGQGTKIADKRVTEGIQQVVRRLRRDPGTGGHAGLFLMRDSVVFRDESLVGEGRPASTIEEFPGYVWLRRGVAGGTVNDKKLVDEPLKENDDGLDALRYVVTDRDPIKRSGLRTVGA